MDLFGISAGATSLGQGTTQAAGAYFGNQLASSATGEAQNFAQFMANTQYRRQVRDLRLAGLNPALAYGGPGAAAPQVPAAQVFAPNIPFDVAGALDSAKNASKLAADVDKARADAATAKNQEKASRWAEEDILQGIEESRSRTNLNYKTELLQGATRDLTTAQKLYTDVNRALGETGLPAARAQMEMDQSDFGAFMRKVNRTIRSVTGSDSTSAR